jgi:hypothetical protein
VKKECGTFRVEPSVLADADFRWRTRKWGDNRAQWSVSRPPA